MEMALIYDGEHGCLVLLMLLSLLAAFTVRSLCLLLDVSSTQAVPGSSVPF